MIEITGLKEKGSGEDGEGTRVKTTFGYLLLQIIQKGKMTRRRINHERTNNPKHMVPPTSKREYLHSLAVSNNTSLTSCSRSVLTPARYVLQTSSVTQNCKVIYVTM